MRWDRLFADLEGQLAAGERRELDDEVAERTRRERALVTLPTRLAAALGGTVRLGLVGGTVVDGELADLGDGWVLVAAAGREVLVPLTSVATVSTTGGPPRPSASRGGAGAGDAVGAADTVATARRFGLGYALRALSRDRTTVAVTLVGGGSPLVGTVDAVGADHLDLAEHPEGTPRRREHVTRTTTVAAAAVLFMESRR